MEKTDYTNSSNKNAKHSGDGKAPGEGTDTSCKAEQAKSCDKNRDRPRLPTMASKPDYLDSPANNSNRSGEARERKTEPRPSEGSSSSNNPNSGEKSFDANKVIERSSSDATLVTETLATPGKQLCNRSGSMDRLQEALDRARLCSSPVSERTTFYADLSRPDMVEAGCGQTPVKKIRMKMRSPDLETIRQNDLDLETIRQNDHEVEAVRQEHFMSHIQPLADLAQRNCVSEGDQDYPIELAKTGALMTESRPSLVDFEDELFSQDEVDSSHEGSFYSKYPLRFPHGYSLGKYRHNLKLSYQTLSQRLEGFIGTIRESTDKQQCRILTDILLLIKEAWNTPVYGRDLAYGLCDIMRMEGLVDLLIHNCGQLDDHDLLLHSANLLEQVMSTRNRERVARYGLEVVVQMAKRYAGDHQMALAVTGILENLFKLSEETCTKVINLGGLDVILRWCRCGTDYHILRRCAKALANLSLFGGAENQEVMAKHNVPEWLFPLAFSDDNSVRYYACLAITALVANKELEASVVKSGTLELVLPFINSTRPSLFAQSDITHKQGRDKIWLKHLIPLLFSRRPEPQALAAFHFAMEAIIKAEQGRQDVFHEIDAVEPLKKIASSPNTVASKLAAEALKVIGEKIPHKLSQQVPLWTVEDVAYWVSQIGFPDYVDAFKCSQVDGDLLLIVNDEDLKDGLGMTSSIVRKRFMRELRSLKITADYSASDPTGLDKWLMGLCPELSQYTYYMLRQGVDTYILKALCEGELREDCGIANSIHRRKIMQNVGELNPDGPRMSVVPPMPMGLTSLDFNASIGNSSALRPIDVFICYRRSSGSQLASLLKVHLQLRGFSVFLDIDRLRAGKFDENLLLSIQMSQHFVLILTHDALDRCEEDSAQEDWVHKEIVAALDCSCNIVPIIDNFDWPAIERLPEDMRGVVRFNCVRWVHEYQDACVDKLETFLRRGGRRMSQQSPNPSSAHMLGSESHLADLSLRSQSSCHSSQSVLDVYST
ncbi:hypothetical protein V1264_021399 [Littorina saxatilis]|uniref:ADP-ribosyl cyclase/cyclic ADP-ribose hydrolase n=2 Tax=Littorina saxatilis TaxID=31220 RepID=A0AAN9AI24_9CAEN